MKKQKLRILQVVPYFYPAWSYGGIPRVVYELSKGLVRRGHEVTVYTTDLLNASTRQQYPPCCPVMIDGIHAYYFPNLSNSFAHRYMFFSPVRMIRPVQHMLREFDILHLHGHRHFLNNVVHFLAMRYKIPYVFSAHGTALRIERRQLLKYIFDIFFGHQILRDAARFIAVSKKEIEQYQQMGIEKERVSMTHNGIEIAAYADLPPRGTFKRGYGLFDKRIILFLGKITPRKGIDVLMKAFSGLPYQDAVLVIAGDDLGFKKELLHIVEEKRLREKVIFTGLLTGKDKLAAYVDAEVLAYPAVHEIFGLVPFEAIMCGTPVIVADDSGCGEIIGSAGIGYLVRYNDVAGLKNRIIEVLENKEESREKVEKGKEFIVENLSWERIVDQVLEVYDRTIETYTGKQAV
ncbi:MAG: glycosyltransferase [Thermodesulfobacteriota bacterium]